MEIIETINSQHQKFESLVEREVERFFNENPPVRGEICENPFTGGTFVGGLDPIKSQKRDALRCLLAREWFAVYGPPDAQPLPLGYHEREALKGLGLLLHILAWYARSLGARGYDLKEHPSFSDYVSGVLWEAALPVGGFAGVPKYTQEQWSDLKKRYPPRMLKGMGPGLYWLPPKLHAEAMDDVRRNSRNGELYLNRE